jgi:hypothetical protein
MLKYFFFLPLLLLATLSSGITEAGCSCWSNEDSCQSLEFAVGWRRDTLKWKVKDIESSYCSCMNADSTIRFNDIDMYTLSGKLRWVGRNYYIRLSGMYALSDKGRAKQHFNIEDSSLFYYDSVSVETNNHIKRRSEFYDFDLAIGYPLDFCCCRLIVIPIIGFSYDRQRINVREKHHHSSSSSSSSYFSVESSSNPFRSCESSNPLSCSSSTKNIASELGLSNDKESANYRFSWYGPLAGLDIAYALDECWTLFTELEGHFLNNLHRKRKSWTGVSIVDDYHHKGWAYGYDALVGTTYMIQGNWYSTISAQYKWWKGHSKHDELHWKSVNVNISVGYIF